MKYLLITIVTLFGFTAVAQEDEAVKITDDSQVPEIESIRVKHKGDSPLFMVKDAQSQLLPDPELTENSFEQYKNSKNAIERFKEPKKLKSITVPISTEPGQDAFEISVGVNYGVTITFKNSNGESLFVHRYKEGREEIINIDDGNGEGEKQVSPFLTITNKSFIGATNLHVWLMNKNHSLSFYTKVVDPGDEYVDRINFVVVDPSDSITNNVIAMDNYTALTMALNNQKPAEKAKKMNFDQAGVTGWEYEGMMWIRTSERLVFPSYSPDMSISSAKENGVNVYYVASHPIIHLVDKSGEFKQLKVRN